MASNWQIGDKIGNRWEIHKILDEAVGCFDRALEINPRDEMAWTNKAIVLRALKRLAEA